jgi:flagellar biosynthetic protein FliR
MDRLVWGFVLAGRIAPVILLVPAFGGRRLPVPARVALVAATVLAVHPAACPDIPAPAGLALAGIVLKELCVGTVLALAATCLFEALRIGGRLVDNLRGASMAHALVPQTNERTSPVADLYLLLAVLAFFAAGGPALFLRALLAGLEHLPLHALPDAEAGREAATLVLALTAGALRTAVAIALPAGLAVLLADVTLGFVNRVAPQVQVFFLGMPLRALLGLAVAALTLDGVLQRFLLGLQRVAGGG